VKGEGGKDSVGSWPKTAPRKKVKKQTNELGLGKRWEEAKLKNLDGENRLDQTRQCVEEGGRFFHKGEGWEGKRTPIGSKPHGRNPHGEDARGKIK